MKSNLRRFLISAISLVSIVAMAADQDTGTINRPGAAYYTGTRYSITFRNADFKDALNFLAKIADINIMIPEESKGTVTASFDNTPIQDAINSIVKANNLDYAIERGIWRVGKTDQFTTSGEDLITETFRLKYASAKDLTDKVKGLLSQRGSVLSDERTNSLVIRERPSNIENVRKMIENVDVRDAQVLIEAKILEATRDFSRALGIQWGVTSNGTRTQLSGVQAVGTDDAGRTLMQNLRMPTTQSIQSPTSGIGMIIGSLAGGTTIDMQITAAEQKGDVNIISEPTIVTSNGVPANIRSGETMYIKTTGDITIGQVGAQSTTAGGGTGLQSVETGIELNVTPQISVDDYIKLNINVQTSQLDFTRSVDGIPVVTDNTASTSVVVKDGDTTVIGGLAKMTGSKTNKDVPGFSKIPVLGEIFKSRAKFNQKKELMVFIKPMIIRDTKQIPDNATYGYYEDLRKTLDIPPAPLNKNEPKKVSKGQNNKYLKYRE